MGLQDELERVEAEAARLRREIAAGPCREHGHDWQFYGGTNAGCGPDCGCSAPVNVCAKCGDCDYGENDGAEAVRTDCAAAQSKSN
ncbi:hypothetical protein J7354_01640 [Sulfitobacter sp. R18_2]|uniref:hypothetical protein n=1 Tax=Sulfitobacter sp. R18_2 TaxID=2821105 RepID=UPI001ADB2992|nr:hypothetical protein [Sulfitobacter sp. R18_2]MBO9437353.1 hypothetical protein [Sulfitobacter sp. R18_2]